MTLLYRYGFLERPRAQLTYYHLPGSRHLVYGLGNKGGALLKQELGDAFTPVPWSEKNQAIGRMFLEHALLVSDVMVTPDKRKVVEALIEKVVIGDGEIDITYSHLPSSEDMCKNQQKLGLG